MTRKVEWVVSLAGKWGGVRSVRVLATTEARARAEAKPFMRLDERVLSAGKAVK